jgi:hypothetical protein
MCQGFHLGQGATDLYIAQDQQEEEVEEIDFKDKGL